MREPAWRSIQAGSITTEELVEQEILQALGIFQPCRQGHHPAQPLRIKAEVAAVVLADQRNHAIDHGQLHIAAKAGVTRATFYNHFAGMAELRDALTYELTHDFLTAVSLTIMELADPRAKAAVAFRFYLHRARADRSWAWSILNMSANGVLFGAETQRHAQETVREGMEAGVLSLAVSELGRDLFLGTAIAAIAAMLRENLPGDYPELVTEHILRGLGVPAEEARGFARMPIPRLATVQS